MFDLPAAFVQTRLERDGQAGQRWIDSLPGLVERLCARWRLRLDTDGGPARGGDNGVVLPVLRADEPAALKLVWNAADLPGELLALRAWAGDGAVRLLTASLHEHAVLLERLDASRTLADLPLLEAAEVAGGLMRQLAVPAPPGLASVAEIAGRIAESLPARNAALGGPIPARWLDRARASAQELATTGGGTLVHADLHYDNVLAGSRQPWLAIDPRAVVGDRAYSVPELMWTRLDEAVDNAAVRRLLAGLVHAGGLDAELARAATVARAADYWLWGLAAGLTEDPLRCRRLLACLAGPR